MPGLAAAAPQGNPAARQFVMGYQLFERGDLQGAYQYLSKMEAGLPGLEDHLLLYRGATAQGLGHYDEAQGLLAQLVHDHRGSVHLAEGLRRLAEVFLALRRFDGGLQTLDDYQKVMRRSGPAGQWVALMKGRVFLERGQVAKGEKVLRPFWIEAPGGLYDDDVRDLLQRHHVEFPEADRARRARGLLKVAQPEKALQIFETLLAASGKETLDWPDWEDGRIQAWMGLGEFDKALERLGTLKQRGLTGHWRDRFRTVEVKILVRQNQLEAAQILLSEDHHTVQLKEPVRRKMAFLKMDGGSYAEGARAFEALISKGRRRERNGAVWMAGWGYFKAGLLDRAASLWEGGLKSASSAGERGRLLYWRGRIFEQLGRVAEARALYCQTLQETGWSYYSFKSAERLEQTRLKDHTCPEVLAATLPHRRHLTHKSSKGKTRLPELAGYHGSRLVRLRQLGLKPLAAKEIYETALEMRGDGDGLQALAVVSQEVGNYVFPVRLAASAFQIGLAGRTPQSMADSAWRFGFPSAYSSELKRCRVQAHVDPDLVLSLMRQESHFQPEVVSSSKAIGLMQVIPPTARRLAGQANLSRFQINHLLQPSVNISLGCRYVSELSDEFDGEVAYIAAAYNAGEMATRRWLKRRRELPVEEFIEEIPFAETNDYVKKVLANYWTYRRLP